MTPNLRAPALAILVLLTLATPAFADGRADWKDYAWQPISLADCAADGAILTCPPYHQKWDWKRNQWVDISISLDLARGQLSLSQRLTNNAPIDDDFVCVTAIGTDAAGHNLIAHHRNWHMDPGEIRQESFSYSSTALRTLAMLHIGSKQCRKGEDEDDALYARVLAGIAP